MAINVRTLLAHLVGNEKYGRAVMPFLKSEYFHDPIERTLFDLIKAYADKYNAFPTKEALYIDLENLSDGISQSQFKECWDVIKDIEIDEDTSHQWLLDHTEDFCKEQALKNALQKGIEAAGKNAKVSRGELPQILQNALNVSFDPKIGHDYLEEGDKRFDNYHVRQERIEFDIDQFNHITNGGLLPKTLNVWMAPTGLGKTLVMCHQAAYNLTAGKNVLYLTLEMAEERIAQRIDQNLMKLTQTELLDLSKTEYDAKLARIKRHTPGRLFVKEYPTATAGANHFRHLIHEIRMKKDFVPHILYIDYLNLCISARIKLGSQTSSYTVVKAIAEELRGLAVEFHIPVVTATQVNREALKSGDVSLENTSESMGLPHTADLMLGFMGDESLIAMNQIQVKQLKNRYGDPTNPSRFFIGMDRSRMRLFNIEGEKQEEADVPQPEGPSSGPIRSFA